MDDVVTVLTFVARKATIDAVFFSLAMQFSVFPVKMVVSISVVASETSATSVLWFGLTEAISLEFVSKLSFDILVVAAVLDLFTLSSSSFAADVIVVLGSAAVSFVSFSRRSVCTTVNNC